MFKKGSENGEDLEYVMRREGWAEQDLEKYFISLENPAEGGDHDTQENLTILLKESLAMVLPQ